MSDPRPIGVFDSGVGGLTVLREILRRTPAESTIYLGDNARAPYGTRSDGDVRAFSTEAIDALVERDVKAVVVACNTSTAVALADLRRRYDLPVLGVIRPGAVTAALTTRNRRVGVIATPATIRSHAYFNAIKDENPAVEVYEHATPAFVPMVEAGELHGPAVEASVRDGLAPLLGARDASGEFVFPLPASARIDTLLLGCTHYPLLRAAIAAVTGERIAIVDSATATASALSELLLINGLEAPGSSRGTAADPGHAGHEPPPTRDLPAVHVQLTTGDVGRFQAIAARMFGSEFPDVEGIDLGGEGGATRRAWPTEAVGSCAAPAAVAGARDRPARGAATGAGRPGSCLARSSARRPRSSAGERSARRGRASSTGRPWSESRRSGRFAHRVG